MKALDYVKRILDLVEIVGNVEVVIESDVDKFEEAYAETQKMSPVGYKTRFLYELLYDKNTDDVIVVN